jgi:flagellar motor switch protein FliG
MRAYILESVEGEWLLAFRTNDPEEIYGVISKLQSTRNKQLKGLAKELEEDFHKRALEKQSRKRYN